jgi:O-antigen/teichoic acid export membrane protein/ribosomal protein L37E
MSGIIWYMESIRTLLQLAQKNLVMLFNAGSLVGTTVVTSLLGFAYWWVATRLYTPGAVGLASAMISAMTLLSTVSMLGLGTLLTGELPRQPGKEWGLIDAALIIVGGAGTVTGIVFALLAPFLSSDLGSLGTNVASSILFALGVGFTALTMVLDQALIGILRGDLQLWRNTLFAAIKLVTLFLIGLFLSPGAGMIIYVTWLIGNVVSLVVIFFGQKPKAAVQETPGKRSLSGSLTGLEKSMTLPCPDCGTYSPKSARFCSNCGYPLSPTVEMASVRPQLFFEYGMLGFLEVSGSKGSNTLPGNLCPDCGHDAPDMARFCICCGYPLTPTIQRASLKINQPRLAIEKEHTQAVPEQSKKNTFLLQWDILHKLRGAALQHHLLNLILLVPPLILPILVTVQLSATENAWFYISFMLANFVFSLTYALSTVLYAMSSAQPSVLAQKMRLTLGLSFMTSLGANLLLQPGAGLLLGIFGHAYADQAAWCLRILSMGVFPLIIISHYVALCRIQNRLISVILPIASGAIIELAGAAIGAHLSGLAGLSLGWLAGLILESLFMVRTVYRAAFPVI